MDTIHITRGRKAGEHPANFGVDCPRVGDFVRLEAIEGEFVVVQVVRRFYELDETSTVLVQRSREIFVEEIL